MSAAGGLRLRFWGVPEWCAAGESLKLVPPEPDTPYSRIGLPSGGGGYGRS